MLRQKQAYLDGLPKDAYVFLSYDSEGKVSIDQSILATHNDMEFQCQAWPNDYIFVQQIMYMSEKILYDSKDKEDGNNQTSMDEQS